MKFQTIDNPLAFCTVHGLMHEPEAPSVEGVLQQLMDALMHHEDEREHEDGHADNLLRFYLTLLDADEEADVPEHLGARAAETLMREAYIEGMCIGYRANKEQRADITENVNAGNSGWWWPEALTYEDSGYYPVSLCEQYGLLLGQRHARQSLALRAYVEKHGYA